MGRSKTLPSFSLNSFVSPSQDGDWYKKVDYQDAKKIIREKMKSSVENFIAIGYYLKLIDETGQYKEDGYANIWECAKHEFGFSQPKASRCINICKAYSVNGDSPYIDERFKNFNTSQLQEMLPFKDDEHLIGQITPDMSSRQIRKEIKNAKKEDAGDMKESSPLQEQRQITAIEGEYREFVPAADSDNNNKGDHDNIDTETNVPTKNPAEVTDSRREELITEVHTDNESAGADGEETGNEDTENSDLLRLCKEDGINYDAGRVTIHLPAAVGDKVYFIGGDEDNNISEGTIDQITLGEGMRPQFRVYDTEEGVWFNFEASDFGQTLLLSGGGQ